MQLHQLFFGLLQFLIFIHLDFSFMTGAPDWSCKDPSAFHTLRLNATHEGIIMPQDMSTNPYTLEVDTTTFKPGSRVTVTIRGTTPDITVNGFFIQAIQANISVRDLRRQPFGTFENTTINERSSKCQPINGIPRGGATHANSSPKERANVVWLAPESYNPGVIQFLATGVNDYSTYWTDIRSPALTPVGYPVVEESMPFHWTPTASWFRWLQYVQQQQLLLDYISQSSNQEAGPSPKDGVTNPQASELANKANDITQKADSKTETTAERVDSKAETGKPVKTNKDIASDKATVSAHQLPLSDPVAKSGSTVKPKVR